MTSVHEWKDAMYLLRASEVLDSTSGLGTEDQCVWARRAYEMLNLRVACFEAAALIRSKL